MHLTVVIYNVAHVTTEIIKVIIFSPEATNLYNNVHIMYKEK